MSQFNKFKVSEIRRETDKAVSINFSIPDNLKNEYSFIAGQYITLKTEINGVEVRRDYSLCSTPNSGELRVAVKEVKDGLFSNYVNNELKVGDFLDISIPNGRFTFDPYSNKSRHIVSFVAGSGITPVISIIKTLLTEEPQSVISVLYGNRSVADCMFYDELNSLRAQYPQRFSLNYIFSQAQEEDALFGRIDIANANYFLKNKLMKTEVDSYYLCGPEEMIYAMSDLLKTKGVDEENIKFELFTVKIEENPEPSNIPAGQAQVKIMLDDEESSFVMDTKNTVLEAALAEDIDAPYSCQGGICSTCLAKLKEGEVRMRQNNILTDAEVAEGLILTCQSHPVTEKIYVDYDDV